MHALEVTFALELLV
ncbi:hypothetical protein D047_0874A, partial [Vibrio parahaemolyticus VPTS-2010_2]